MPLIFLFVMLGSSFVTISGNMNPDVLFREMKSTQTVGTTSFEVLNERYVWVIENFVYFTAKGTDIWSPPFPVKEAGLNFSFFINWNEENGDIFLRFQVSSDSETAKVTWQGTINFLDAESGEAKMTKTFPLAITAKSAYSAWLGVISVAELMKLFPANGKQKHLPIVFNASITGKIENALKPKLNFIRSGNGDYQTFSTFGEALLQNKQLCDLTIIVKGESFCTHKAMLLTRANNTFHALMSNSSSILNGRQQIQIDSIDVNIFEILLNFAYTDKEPQLLSTDTLKKLLVATAQFPFARLENFCLERIATEVRIENAIEWYKFAIQNGITKLQNFMLEYFRMNAIIMGESN